MVCLLALDDVLRLVLGRVMKVALEPRAADNLLHDHAANSSRFRVPTHMIAAPEVLAHTALTPLWPVPLRIQEPLLLVRHRELLEFRIAFQQRLRSFHFFAL